MHSPRSAVRGEERARSGAMRDEVDGASRRRGVEPVHEERGLADPPAAVDRDELRLVAIVDLLQEGELAVAIEERAAVPGRGRRGVLDVIFHGVTHRAGILPEM